MKAITFFLFCICIICYLSGCKDNQVTNDEVNTETTLLSINMHINYTRSSIKEGFVPGDQIGLNVLLDGTDEFYITSDFKGQNIPATYSDSYIWEQSVYLTNEKVNIYAFYPFTWHPATGNMEYMFTMSDNIQYMYGTHTKGTLSYVDRFNPSVQLELKHALGVAEFFFRLDPEYPKNGVLKEIELYNRDMPSGPIPSDVTVNIITGAVRTMGAEHPIVIKKRDGDNILQEITTSYLSKGIVAHVLTNYATKSKGEIIARFLIDDKDFLWELPIGTEWKAGYKYKYYVTVVGGSLSIESIIMESLEDGGSKDVELQ